MTDFQPIFKITPGVQSYDWGKIGSTSLAAQFGERCIEDFTTDDSKPYAEVRNWFVRCYLVSPDELILLLHSLV